MTQPLKKYETIGCCGIDCALCPRYYTNGPSKCPGCGGLDFKTRHPACSILTCCAVKNGLEVCALCPDYPCRRFDSEKNGYDSFVTHQKIFVNHQFVKTYGIEKFIENQKIRMEILQFLLDYYDDGRSKSFYCLGCALLPIDKLIEIPTTVHPSADSMEFKEKCAFMKEWMLQLAHSINVNLKLNHKK